MIKFILISILQTNAEFEPVSLDTESTISAEGDGAKLVIDDNNHNTDSESHANFASLSPMKKLRRVRFSMMREVRRLPERIALEAKMARLPYQSKPIDCHDYLCGTSHNALVFGYLVYFAPLWILSSVTYHAALAYSSVSLVLL